MKLTWFGGTTVRIHVGGAILVGDAKGAPARIDRTELVSGADRVFALDGADLPVADGASWKPRRQARLLDEGEVLPEVLLWSVTGGVLVDAIGEAPLLLASDDLGELGRWADGAVVVLFGDGAALSARGQAVLDARTPKVIALAAGEDDVDIAIAALRDRLDGTGLFSLEPGMALEI
ncbi:hypothetical protein WH87_03025 [Devosia epidermidihirudinis]|uniref:Uncharacterized protein n=1 Tax=Devosia epidermidihirudinis TaxID=1293439 RepID=A0A0F5QE42_9HYPH|nr:hypothetical protein [Devosia epidermidihirudinis]KKC39220.1 hypothetical protein WH87_03025 [Devosia epidermidihirudinis]